MDFGLRGEVAVIVGGARGIGRAIAQAFAQEGAAVALVDRDSGVAAVAQGVGEAHSVPWMGTLGDITDSDSLRTSLDAIRSRLGRVDHAVCAAAIGSGKFGFPFWDLTPADWPRVLTVNITGAAHFAHAFAEPLRVQRSGTMLFLASIAGQIGSQTDPPYSASKAAVINFMQCCAKDLAPYGVRVNAVSPGMVKTDLNRSVWAAWATKQAPETRQTYDEWAGEKIRRMVPLGRWQDAEDVAAAAVFLASARAKNITGQTLNVDGGMVMHS